jgi:hypothetical protein
MQQHGAKRAFFKASGQGLFILLAILLLISVGLIFSLASSGMPAINKDKQTAQALAQAKEALIAYAISDLNRPGELPCPDYDNDGDIKTTGPNADYSGSNCKTEVVGGVIQPGWLPWVELRLPDLRDGNGDRLWYVVSESYHSASSATLNSATPGQLNVDGVKDIVAVVFSPGPPLSNQTGRQNPNCASPPCGNAINDIGQYLEGGNEAGGGNVNYTNYPNSTSSSANDRLITINRQDLRNTLAFRIAREISVALDSYHVSNATYPDAATNNINFICKKNSAGSWLPLYQGNCTALTNFPSWLTGTSTQWQLVTTYIASPPDTATLQFTNCASVFTLNWNAGTGKSDIRRDTRC